MWECAKSVFVWVRATCVHIVDSVTRKYAWHAVCGVFLASMVTWPDQIDDELPEDYEGANSDEYYSAASAPTVTAAIAAAFGLALLAWTEMMIVWGVGEEEGERVSVSICVHM